MPDQNNKVLSPSSSGDMALIDESAPNRNQISIQVLQNIYHELTGKSEEVSKSYDNAFHIVSNNFKQLNFRIQQSCEQYNICASNCAINVFYVNDTKDTFSSFERFEAFNTGSTSPVESVLLTYNFLIILPKVAERQSYTVSIRVASPIAINRKMNGNFFSMPKIFRMMGSKTAVISVKYVDYAVARTMLNTIDEWFMALPQSKSGFVWNFLRKHTDYIPLVARYIACIAVTALIVSNLQILLPASPSLFDLAKFIVLAFVSIFAAYKIAYHLGSAAEDSIDRWVDLSYICITDGDRNELRLAEARNRGALLWGGVKFIGALLVSVVAKLIVYRITGMF